MIVDGGNVGIGITSPTDKLTIDGAIRLIPRSSASCGAGNEGALYYDSEDDIVYVCRNGIWQALSQQSTQSVVCVSATFGHPGTCSCARILVSQVTTPQNSSCTVSAGGDSCQAFADGTSTGQCCVCAY